MSDEARIAHSNRIIEDLVRDTKLAHYHLKRMGVYLRSFTFRVMDDDNTKFHVTYRRK